MKKNPKVVAVTGGAGQIAYSALFQIASGEMLGSDQPISLRILDIPEVHELLQGIVMELQDCAFPLLHDIYIGTDPFEIFEGAQIVLLLGAKPRGNGMERKELLFANAKIFIEQGKALNEKADPNAVVFIVGNPCNTNAWIVFSHAPKLNPNRIFSMSLLDENRAKAQLALKANVFVKDVQKMIIWGNHSSTLVPDFTHVHIQDRPIKKVILDHNWLETTFIEMVQDRGSAIISARGKSSAASAAHAAIASIRALFQRTKEGEWFSVSLLSNGNPYGIQDHIFFSFPCISKGDAQLEIVPGLKWNSFIKGKIKISEKELIEERERVR